jgi:hypothetical protein
MVFGVKMYFRAHIYIDILRISMYRYMAAPVCRGICMLTYRQYPKYQESNQKGESIAQIMEWVGISVLPPLSLIHINSLDAPAQLAPLAEVSPW